MNFSQSTSTIEPPMGLFAICYSVDAEGIKTISAIPLAHLFTRNKLHIMEGQPPLHLEPFAITDSLDSAKALRDQYVDHINNLDALREQAAQDRQQAEGVNKVDAGIAVQTPEMAAQGIKPRGTEAQDPEAL